MGEAHERGENFTQFQPFSRQIRNFEFYDLLSFRLAENREISETLFIFVRNGRLSIFDVKLLYTFRTTPKQRPTPLAARYSLLVLVYFVFSGGRKSILLTQLFDGWTTVPSCRLR